MASDRDILKILGQRTEDTRRDFGIERKFSRDNYAAVSPKTGRPVRANITAPSKVQRRTFMDAEGGVRAALMDPETGTIGRGRAHFMAAEDLGNQLGISSDEAIDRSFMKTARGTEAQGFTRGSEGKWSTRADEAHLARNRHLALEHYELGDSEIGPQAESHAVQVREQDRSAVDKRRSYRAHSDDKITQARRQVRASAAHEGVGRINSEIKELAASNPEQSSAKSHRLQQLVRRKGLLQSLAKKAGVMGIVSTPFATIENIKGLFSSDENQVSKSIGELTGMPDVIPRGMTEQEKEDRPIWHDRTTGEFKF
jgi:hypothetical protein